MASAWPPKHEERATARPDVAQNTHALQWGVPRKLYFVSAEQVVQQASRLLKLVIF